MKKLKYILLIIIFLIVCYFINARVYLNIVINNTVDNYEKINYDTNIILKMNNKNYSSKIEYKIKKYMNIRNITINNYVNNELNNNIYEYIVKENNKYTTYIYNDEKYEKKSDEKNLINVDYKKLKESIKGVKRKKGSSYTVKMNAYDAYNLIYNDDVMKKEDLDKVIDVVIKINRENDFIEEISYTINNINNSKENSLDYSVKITNYNINNKNEIKLPF